MYAADKGRGKGGKAPGDHFREVYVREELEPRPRSNERNLLYYWCKLPTKFFSAAKRFQRKNAKKKKAHYVEKNGKLLR